MGLSSFYIAFVIWHLETSFTMAECSVPPNFSWVQEGVLAGSGCPTRAEHFNYYHEVGIRHVIALKENYPHGAEENCKRLNMKLSKIYIIDFHPPTQEQINEFLQMVEEGIANKEPVVVHCALGQGRTGTMLACYLIKHKNLTGQEALKEIRRIRPRSVETREQEQAIEEFYQNWKRKQTCPNDMMFL